MLLNKAIENFLLSLEANGHASRTIDTYRWRLADLQQFIEAQGLATDVEGLKPEDLDAWAVSLRRQDRRWADHPVRPQQKGGLSASSIAGRIQAVKTFMTWCVQRDYIRLSPAEHLDKPRVDLSASDRVMALEDLLAILDVAENLASSGRRLFLRDLAIVAFMYETGCRPG